MNSAITDTARGHSTLSGDASSKPQVLTVQDMGIEKLVLELRARAGRWFGKGKKFGLFALCGVALTSIAQVAAAYFDPSLSLGAALDVPAQLAAQFPLPARSVSAAVDALSGKLTIAALGTVAVGVVIAGLRWAMYDSEESRSFAGIAGMAVLGLAVIFAAPKLLDTFDEEKPASVGASAPSNHDERLLEWLSTSHIAHTPAALYVRAQGDVLFGTGDDPIVKEAAAALRSTKLDFTPSPRFTYLIEDAAYGKAISPAAVAYFDTAKGYSRLFQGTSYVAAGVTLPFIVLSSFFFVLGWLVSRRRARLFRTLIAQHRRSSLQVQEDEQV